MRDQKLLLLIPILIFHILFDIRNQSWIVPDYVFNIIKIFLLIFITFIEYQAAKFYVERMSGLIC